MISPLKIAHANANLEFKQAFVDIEQVCGLPKRYTILSLWNAEDEISVDIDLCPQGETEFEMSPDGTEYPVGTLHMHFERTNPFIEKIVQQLTQ